jgi:hypothetical protein
VAKSPFAKATPRSSSGKGKLNKNTMTFLLDELKELRKMVGAKKPVETAKQVWGCKQCLSKVSTWREQVGEFSAWGQL